MAVTFINLEFLTPEEGMEIFQWCSDQFEDSQWGKAIVGKQFIKFYFNYEKDAMLFTLRWVNRW